VTIRAPNDHAHIDSHLKRIFDVMFRVGYTTQSDSTAREVLGYSQLQPWV
jgi:hypothetical protein